MSHNNEQLGDLSPNVEALVTLAREQLGELSADQCLRGERAIRRQFFQSKRQAPVWRVRSLAAASVLMAALVVGFYAMQNFRSAPLTYQVENGIIASDQVLLARGLQAPVLRFSDGTEVKFESNAKARIRYVTDHGAALALEQGNLHAAVVHSAKSEWRFDVGPYVVNVTGTSFGVAWEPRQDRFDLKLEHGTVTVHAPVSNGPIPLRAGQWLTIRSRSNEVLIRDLTTQVEAGANVPEAQAFAPDGDAPSAASALASSGAASGAVVNSPAPSAARESDAHRRWVKDLSDGKLDLIVADAEQRGIQHCLNSVSSDELSALADAARYTRRNEIARMALLAQRSRFGGSRRAAEAAFLLGKLAEAERANSSALKYFRTYLTESPNGRYAGEAMGRKMAIIQQTAGSAKARPIALEYLSRYPTGTYAPAARAIVSGP